MTVDIAIVNQSSVVSDSDLKSWLPALQKQINQDFAPIWLVNARLSLVSRKAKLSNTAWQITILDTSDQADDLGYHDLTADGLPLGKVFAQTDIKAGASVSVTLSHELLEMLGDPWINLAVQMDDGKFYAFENCDAVEADNLGYTIGSVMVSDFVLPAYFEIGTHAKKFDFRGHLSGPCPRAMPGGYLSYFDPVAQGWSQLYARRHRHDLVVGHPPIGSRRWRRGVMPSERLRSRI